MKNDINGKKELFQRRRQNQNRTRPDHGPDHGSDRGSDHGPDHRKKILKNEKIQIQDSKFC